jgi:hypothetical protein
MCIWPWPIQMQAPVRENVFGDLAQNAFENRELKKFESLQAPPARARHDDDDV